MKFVNAIRVLRYLPWSIYFNFHYLPFGQAIHLPILLYKPRILKSKGHVKIECPGGGKIWNDSFGFS